MLWQQIKTYQEMVYRTGSNSLEQWAFVLGDAAETTPKIIVKILA